MPETSEDLSAVAFELTCAGVYSEDTLAEYVGERVTEMDRAQLVDLISFLSAVGAAAWEQWAAAEGREVSELLQAATLNHATRL